MSTVKNVLDTALKWLCIVLFTSLVAVVVWQVFSRQVLNAPATWTTSVAQYLFVWLALFGAAWVFSEKEHIAVDFMTRILGVNDKRWLEAAVNGIVFAFAALVLFWGGLRGVDLTWTQKVSGLPVSVGMMYLALPVSGAITMLYSLLHLVEALRGRGLPDDGEEIREAV
ncbi:TRAP transporter small permease [Zafaria sp. Z1313]|uniref:TRAP transporter small permease n=1 Tax=unclassified Zafaria TaxID=2828765 RepID=UPI002E797F05|nr:TRAP transporter small permease [Zafaria sp. J156]MEE1621811.1 TRAP transporter small permease [Zafaria sp. J156]